VVEQFDLQRFSYADGLLWGLMKAPFPLPESRLAGINYESFPSVDENAVNPRPFSTDQFSSLLRASAFTVGRSR
jgi:hypothetical protein